MSLEQEENQGVRVEVEGKKTEENDSSMNESMEDNKLKLTVMSNLVRPESPRIMIILWKGPCSQ